MIRFVPLLLVAGVGLGAMPGAHAAQDRPVDDHAAPMTTGALLDYAAKGFDKAALAHTRAVVGTHNGVPVVAEYPCADVCPQYTVRIIHYQLPPGRTCDSVGGVEQSVDVPVAIAAVPKTFCFPKALVDNGTAFTR